MNASFRACPLCGELLGDGPVRYCESCGYVHNPTPDVRREASRRVPAIHLPFAGRRHGIRGLGMLTVLAMLVSGSCTVAGATPSARTTGSPAVSGSTVPEETLVPTPDVTESPSEAATPSPAASPSPTPKITPKPKTPAPSAGGPECGRPTGGFDWQAPWSDGSLATVAPRVPLAAAVPSIAPGHFAAAATPPSGGGYDTATLLPNGKVLFLGGGHPELYDPAANSWTQAGAMVTERDDPLVAPLPGGKVLVVGGMGFGGCANMNISTVEVYDSATNKFLAISSPLPGDSYGTATALADGTVLLAGGWTIDDSHPDGYRTSALFNPSGNTFSLIAGSVQPAGGAAVARLQNGTVLFAGGYTEPPQTVYTAVAAAVIYRPAQHDFVALPHSLAAARAEATATALADGRVLIAGGASNSEANCPTGCLGSAEIYDPATGQFSPTGPMISQRYRHSATLLPGDKVLVAGGYVDGTQNSAEVWASSSFGATSPMTHSRSQVVSVMLPNGRALVVGNGTADLYQP